MLGRKYIFESAETRLKRYFRNFLVFLGVCLAAILILCVGIVFDAKNNNDIAENAFFRKPPALIVVFTGDKGRIQHAFALGRNYKQSHIFITGVYAKNTVSTFFQASLKDETIDPKLLEIDYLARNTVENVINLYRYLKLNPGHNRVLVVSHDYHITRIKTIVKGLSNHWDIDGNYQFYYSSVESNYGDFSNVKKLIMEVPKLLKAAVTILFWEDEN